MSNYLLQVLPDFDIWQKIDAAGGIVGVLLAIAVVCIWRAYNRKDAALEKLNKQVQEDARESMRITTAMEKVLDRILSDQTNGESRLAQIVRSEAEATRDMIIAFKDHINERIRNEKAN